MGDLVFGTEAHHLLTIEVCPIVGDDGMREPKATYDDLLEEFDYLLSHDVREWHPYTDLVKYYVAAGRNLNWDSARGRGPQHLAPTI